MLSDANIEFITQNKNDIGQSVYVGSTLSTDLGISMKIFVHSMEEGKAISLITEDKSEIMDNPELDFGTEENYEKADDELNKEKKKP